MSWFSDFLSGGSWVAPLISGAASVTGAVIASNANERASERAAQAAQQQAEEIRRGNTLAQQRFEQNRADAEPGMAYQRQMIGQADQLTDAQRAQLDDVRRVTGNQLALSGLRGSGRAAVAAVRRSETDFVNSAMESNRRRADQAAGSLAQQGFRANELAANTDAATGRAIGQGAMQAGLYDAESGLANAQIRGRAIGDIGTIINDTLKEGRKSNYGRRPTEATA